ncbi:MAG: universal stress protein [Actinomycetia bacterium]|nr:universal stress protein [Actinomycetes bacterium]
MLKTFVLATDGSESANGAHRLAADLLQAVADGRLTVVYVRADAQYLLAPDIVVPDALIEAEEAFEKALEERIYKEFAAFAGRVTFVRRQGHPATEICRVADQLDADVIIVGSHGRGALERTFIGSVSRAVLNQTRRPVLVAR